MHYSILPLVDIGRDISPYLGDTVAKLVSEFLARMMAFRRSDVLTAIAPSLFTFPHPTLALFLSTYYNLSHTRAHTPSTIASSHGAFQEI